MSLRSAPLLRTTRRFARCSSGSAEPASTCWKCSAGGKTNLRHGRMRSALDALEIELARLNELGRAPHWEGDGVVGQRCAAKLAPQRVIPCALAELLAFERRKLAQV